MIDKDDFNRQELKKATPINEKGENKVGQQRVYKPHQKWKDEGQSNIRGRD